MAESSGRNRATGADSSSTIETFSCSAIILSNNHCNRIKYLKRANLREGSRLIVVLVGLKVRDLESLNLD
jgi:hypothetical protein